MREFEGKVAILFGAARGIGAAAARAFHREGASVIIGDVLDAEGVVLAAELGRERARYGHCDVGEFGQIEAAYAVADEAFGGVWCSTTWVSRATARWTCSLWTTGSLRCASTSRRSSSLRTTPSRGCGHGAGA